ncbi:hypothetical protein [Halobaculum sp. D14]|uniref:hypothetical protein n=1 Tax=Halobaculum sp. D14 TaxID=3421642 RepID=UPI003EB7D538
MNDRAATVLRIIGVQAAAVAAAVHLFVGLPKLAVYLPLLSAADPRPYLFVPSAVLLLVLAAVVVRGAHHRRLYALTAGVLGTYLVGYCWWHLTGHGGLYSGHGVGNPVTIVAGHLATDALALVSFAAELVGVAAFLALFVGDPEAQHGANSAKSANSRDGVDDVDGAAESAPDE